MEAHYHPQCHVSRIGLHFLFFNTVIAKAVKTGAGAALIHINFTARASEAPATVAAEAQREMVLIQLLHAHRAVLARIVGLAG